MARIGLTREAWCTGLGVSPFVIAGAWGAYECALRPRLIPRARIAELADAVIQEHPDDPEAWARREEHAAWFRSHAFEQGQWRRVREHIQKRRLGDATGGKRAQPSHGAAAPLRNASHLRPKARVLDSSASAETGPGVPINPLSPRPIPKVGARRPPI